MSDRGREASSDRQPFRFNESILYLFAFCSVEHCADKANGNLLSVAFFKEDFPLAAKPTNRSVGASDAVVDFVEAGSPGVEGVGDGLLN
jgi:hypothetical protein